MHALTNKQKRFVEEYVADFNASAAALRAGYSKHTANKIGGHLMMQKNIRAAIEEKQAALRVSSEIKVTDVLKELARVGFSSITDVVSFDADGVVIHDSAIIPREVSCAIAEVSSSHTKEGINVKVKMHNKLAALETICKILGFFKSEDKNDGADVASILTELLRLAGANR